MNPNIKLALTAVGVFAVVVSADVVSKSLYTNVKLGVDKKTLIIASIVGVGSIFLMSKMLKTKIV
jgi:hypothetical protein